MTTYVIDFLNLFSDYREIKYKRLNIDFHTIKDRTLIEDTRQFFHLFFTKYINYLTLTKNSHYIFITKKIKKIESIIPEILDTHRAFSMEFLVIETIFSDSVFDKEKDDVLCQYLCTTDSAVYLLSNDKYRKVKNKMVAMTVMRYSKSIYRVKQVIILKELAPLPIKKYGIPKRKLSTVIF